MSRPDGIPPLIDIHSDERFMRLHETVDPHTMTPLEVQYALYRAVLHIHERGIPGAIAECGVWKAGSMLLAAKLLADLGDTDRDFWLYDTFGSGMTEPGPGDINVAGEPGERLWKSEYLKVDLSEVLDTMALSGYPKEKIKYIVGDVRDTAKMFQPPSLALLRLDTDFEDSTRVELQCLYPLLASGGVLILDDPGHWRGCQKAVDEYFEHEGPFLQRINYSARMGVKP